MKSGGLSDTEITELKSFPNKNYGKGTKIHDDEDDSDEEVNEESYS